MTLDLYAASSRPVTRRPDRETTHSFSFGEHYDPANLGFGPLVAHNDDLLSPGGGYPTHPHRDLEILTWVLSGALVHTDSLGNSSVLEPGTVQVQSAGSGITHSEQGDLASGPTRFVQAWVRPDAPGGTPSRAEAAPMTDSGLVQVAGGSALPVGAAGASFWVGSVSSRVVLPEAPLLHVFDAISGDAWRIRDEPGRELSLAAPGLLLVWAFA
ncbi:pirin family protein [Nocardioides sp. LHG3406-4]|uniref:pirin family protein n=1 Tax=Nocardioides sp. LHG3406-4 TaxID=2804575 RepID=UPI003CEEEA79